MIEEMKKENENEEEDNKLIRSPPTSLLKFRAASFVCFHPNIKSLIHL